MDSFLLEGRKIMFRLSLAIFKLHENRILSMTDPVTIFMLVKEISKHIFDMDEVFKASAFVSASWRDIITMTIKIFHHSSFLFFQFVIFLQVAFSEFNPFPSRSNIKSRCKPYLKEYLGEWKERERTKTNPVITSPPPLTIASITPAQVNQNKQKKHIHWECGTVINPG